jgi:hypothetical protein
MKKSAQDKQLYQIIRVDGDTLHYEARTPTGEMFDVFELRKRSDGRNRLVEFEEIEKEKQNNGAMTYGVLGVSSLVGLAGVFLVVRGIRRWSR